MTLSVEHLLGMHLRAQVLYSDRYLAEPEPEFGVCAFVLPRTHALDLRYSIQFFPTFGFKPPEPNYLLNHYASFIMSISRRVVSDEQQLKINRDRRLFPYVEAPDVLTALALIHDATTYWQDNRYV